MLFRSLSIAIGADFSPQASAPEDAARGNPNQWAFKFDLEHESFWLEARIFTPDPNNQGNQGNTEWQVHNSPLDANSVFRLIQWLGMVKATLDKSAAKGG